MTSAHTRFCIIALLAPCVVAESSCVRPLRVDVAIIGGGASGSYAAAQLTDVYNKSIILVEATGKLGGHANTAAVPLPGGGTTPVDFGAMAYLNMPGVEDFFARYGVKLVPAVTPASTAPYAADFRTGQNVTLPSSDPEAIAAAVQKWLAICQQYWHLLSPSFAATVGDVEDLVMPFGDFVDKYDLQALVPVMNNWIWRIDLFATPTMYVMTTAGPLQVLATLPNATYTFHIPESHNNSEVYANIRQHLGDRVLLQSHVSEAKRGPHGIRLVVSTPTGPREVYAKQVLIAMPPLLESMNVFDLSPSELSTLSGWTTDNIIVTLLGLTGLPNATVQNYNASATPYLLPSGRFVNAFSSYVPGLHHASALSPDPLTVDEAKAMITGVLQNLRDGGAFPSANSNPVFLGIAKHSPGLVCQPTERLRQGVFADLIALQGKRRTWFTGGTWTTDLTATVWTHAEAVLQDMLKEDA